MYIGMGPACGRQAHGQNPDVHRDATKLRLSTGHNHSMDFLGIARPELRMVFPDLESSATFVGQKGQEPSPPFLSLPGLA
jgi:hypothetical protein